MRALLNRFLGDIRGLAAIEFAAALPLFMLVTAGLVDVGRGLNHASGVERGLRAAAALAAQLPLPLSAADQTMLSNIVKTGEPTGTRPLLAGGWTKPGASLLIEVTSRTVDGTPVTIVRLTAVVPLVPLIPGWSGVFGLGSAKVSAVEEAVHVDD